VAAPPSPASEAPRQHGCRVELRPQAGGFAVLADDDGRTSVAGILACGDVCGATTAERAAAAGARAGRTAAQEAARAREAPR
jgi:thioredoxin reductase